MVCNRCVMTVESILEKNEIAYQRVIFGEIHLRKTVSQKQKDVLLEDLRKVGFDLIESHVAGVIEKIKKIVIERARNESKERKENLSSVLSAKLNYEYTHLSSLFSEIEGRTIENFYIEHRIEKAKELLIYGQKTLEEIAFDLDYSSAAHLSGQFKKVTGLTPSHFKKIGAEKRRALDSI